MVRKLLETFLLAAATAGSSAQAQAPTACTLLTAPAAAAIAGSPLPENFKNEMRPNAENGHDHTTACGWFPKGYKLATASAPPEAGVLLTLHTMRTPAEAAAFHDMGAQMAEQMARSGVPKPVPAAGVGENARLQQEQFSGTHIATIAFLKGRVAAQLQVWQKSGPAGDKAVAAAKQFAGKL